MAAIELRGAVKRFGPIVAVDGLDLEVPEGICLGLLGPNGAGKSTTMRLLTGQAIADAGELRVLGHELPGDAKAARAEMGVVPQLDNLDVDVTVEDNLAVYARLYRVRDVGAAVDRALDLARLRDRRREAVDKLSSEPLCDEGEGCAANRKGYGCTSGTRRTPAARSPAAREQASDHEISNSVQQTDFFGARVRWDTEEIDGARNCGSHSGKQAATEHVVAGAQQAAIAGGRPDYVERGYASQQSERKNDNHLMNRMS